MQKGYNVFFKNDVCTIFDKSPSRKMIAKVHMTNNRILPLKLRLELKEEGVVAAITQEKFQEEIKDENWVWNLRFFHLNFGGLNLLHRKCMVKGLPLIEKPDNLCEGCILFKQHRESFPTKKSIREKGTFGDCPFRFM